MWFRYVIQAWLAVWIMGIHHPLLATSLEQYVTQQPSCPSDSTVIRLNQASVEELLSLKGIGRKRAQAIVDYRGGHGPFISIEQLLEVPGISNRVLAQNRACLAL